MKSYRILEDDRVEILEDGKVVRTYSEQAIIEDAINYYEAAGFSPAMAFIAQTSYEDLVCELLFEL